MSLPQSYNVSFERYTKDLVEQALNRMLSQHYDKCVLRQFVAAFLDECNELYAACIELQRKRTVFNASGANLDALGRIVGEKRSPWTYDESSWFFFDRQGQSFDQVPVWCINAPVGKTVYVEDPQYRTNIIVRAVKNHTLTSSIPEVTNVVELAFGTNVSFEKTGPNAVKLIVPSNISLTNLLLLTQGTDDERVDDRFWLPYPVTLSISDVTMFVPGDFFIFDVDRRGWDQAPLAVGVTEIAPI